MTAHKGRIGVAGVAFPILIGTVERSAHLSPRGFLVDIDGPLGWSPHYCNLFPLATPHVIMINIINNYPASILLDLLLRCFHFLLHLLLIHQQFLLLFLSSPKLTHKLLVLADHCLVLVVDVLHLLHYICDQVPAWWAGDYYSSKSKIYSPIEFFRDFFGITRVIL